MAWVEVMRVRGPDGKMHPTGKFRGGFMDPFGKKRQRGGFTNRSAARKWAETCEEAAWRGETFDARDGRTLFREFAERWYAARLVETSTAATEKKRFDLLVEKWGDTPIGLIGSIELQGWVKEMSQDRAAATVRKYHGLMSVILGAATKPPHRLITENPCRHVTLPALPHGREVYMTEDQVAALLGELTQPWRTLTRFLAYTGMRWGEAAGLHANRIDWLRQRVQVVDVLGHTTAGFHWKSYPKGRERRWVPLPDHLLEALSVHVKTYPAIDCGLHKDCQGLVFASKPRWSDERGPLLNQTYGRHIFGPAAERAKLPDGVRPHDLRHSYASWLVQAGVPIREVQYLLGHASVTTTERYSHFAPDAGDLARAVLDRGNPRGNDRAI